MDLGPLKAQIMAMLMVKSSQPGTAQKSFDDIWMLIYSMLVMNLVEYAFRHAPAVAKFAKDQLTQRLKVATRGVPLLKDTLKESAEKKEQIFSVTLIRKFGTQQADGKSVPVRQEASPLIEKVDAVLQHICNLEAAHHIRIETRCILNSIDELQITPILKAKIKQSGDAAATDQESMIEIMLYSSVMQVPDIRKWIDDVYSEYMYERNNKLGSKIFYFNEVPIEPPREPMFALGSKEQKETPAKFRYRLDNANKNLLFTMTEFSTAKSFSNIYGSHVDELRERIDLFMNHPEWYIERGIPHTLGIMMHGIPGAGKTSTIKAIARDTNRHIFNLSLRQYTTCTQLTNLFYNDTVRIMNEQSQITYNIPKHKRIYVIEDIDCLTDVVLARTGEEGQDKNQVSGNGDAITLSFLLNLLDGVLETPGRILIITTNYPDKIDSALIRPGRIDVRIEFKRASREFVLDMLNHFYGVSYTVEDIPESIADKFTPAEVMESMCVHFKDPDSAIRRLVAAEAAVSAQATSTTTEMSEVEADLCASVNEVKNEFLVGDDISGPNILEEWPVQEPLHISLKKTFTSNFEPYNPDGSDLLAKILDDMSNNEQSSWESSFA
jgi:SpoVK/Ycf46/Vps4 family AAA+-type ATPase